MKVRIASSLAMSPEAVQELRDAADEGLLPEVTTAEFAKTMQGVETISLAPNVAAYLKSEGITPDEFVASILKSIKATH